MANKPKLAKSYRAGSSVPDEIVEKIEKGIEENGSFSKFVNKLVTLNDEELEASISSNDGNDASSTVNEIREAKNEILSSVSSLNDNMKRLAVVMARMFEKQETQDNNDVHENNAKITEHANAYEGIDDITPPDVDSLEKKWSEAPDNVDMSAIADKITMNVTSDDDIPIHDDANNDDVSENADIFDRDYRTETEHDDNMRSNGSQDYSIGSSESVSIENGNIDDTDVNVSQATDAIVTRTDAELALEKDISDIENSDFDIEITYDENEKSINDDNRIGSSDISAFSYSNSDVDSGFFSSDSSSDDYVHDESNSIDEDVVNGLSMLFSSSKTVENI